jgi:hypothetical protein
MPKVQYLGPYDHREIDRRQLSDDPSAPLEEGEEPEILVWDKEGDLVELTADECTRLVALTGGSTWRLEDEPAPDDESSSEPDASASSSGSDQEAGQSA